MDTVALCAETSAPHEKAPILKGYPDVLIAFQGMLGAYSHLATRALYPQAKLLPCADFSHAFAAVEDGRASVAVIPIENSLGGRVADIHSLLSQSSLHIIGEYCHFVEHCLLGVEGAKFSDITKVYSHVQGLSQCQKFLRTHALQSLTFSDTAAAAAYIGRKNVVHKGAIASKLAANIYGLKILQENIQDGADNITRFVILSGEKSAIEGQGTQQITSCLFFTRDIPANLYKALGGFATNGINIIKLESYVPIFGSKDSASFYIEFQGNPQDASVRLALEELRFFSTSVRIFGTYAENRTVKKHKKDI